MRQGDIIAAFRAAVEGIPHGQSADSTPRTKPITYKYVASQAWRLYCLGISPGERRPSKGTFQSYTKKAPLAPVLRELFEAFGIQKRQTVKTIRHKVLSSFRQALSEMQPSTTPTSSTQIAYRAYKIYCRLLDEHDPRPARKTFKALVYTTRKSNQAIIAMLREAGVEKQVLLPRSPGSESIRRPRAFTKLEAGEVVKAIREAMAEKERVVQDEPGKGDKSPKLFEITRAAFGIYCKGSSTREGLRFKRFRRFVEGLLLAQLLRLKGSREGRRIDHEMLLDAFRKALAILKAQRVDTIGGRPIRPQQVANLAHGIYCRGISNIQPSPSIATFQNLVSGKQAKKDVLQLLQQSGVVSSMRTGVKKDRKRDQKTSLHDHNAT